MPFCAAVGCSNASNRHRQKGRSFHMFPLKDPGRLKLWILNTNRDKWKPNSNSALCSDHFTEDSFDRTGQTIRLKENATPTIFKFPHVQKKTSQLKLPFPRTPITEVATNKPSLETSSPDGIHKTAIPSTVPILADHSYAILESPKKLKRKIEKYLDTISSLQKNVKRQQKSRGRLKKRVQHLKAVIKSLKGKNIISSNCSDLHTT